MNRKISPAQARDINRLVNTEHLLLREVQQYPEYAKLSLTQIHRVSTGKNWSHATGLPDRSPVRSLEKENR